MKGLEIILVGLIVSWLSILSPVSSVENKQFSIENSEVLLSKKQDVLAYKRGVGFETGGYFLSYHDGYYLKIKK